MDEASSHAAAKAAPVRAVAVSRVAPSVLGQGQRGERVKLSFLDSLWVVLPPIQRVFLYQLGEDGGSDDGFQAVVERLKRALADTLAHYLPLAGTLEYVVETGDAFVDCTNAGVAFIEAEGGMDVHRLAGDEAHDTLAFLSLVPELDARVLPAPVLSVQATRLSAGLAVGLSVHHAVADGRAVWRFMEAWSSAAREGSPVTKVLGPPHYSRDVISHPNADELAREMLKTVAPNLPKVRGQYDFSQRFLLARRTFYLGADEIRSLRRRIDDLACAAATEARGAGTANTGDEDGKDDKRKHVSGVILKWRMRY
ncbi:Malonyl-coenzyme A:anthocyanin 3-O-glucoside-6''-O-malonyltransferase [Triticum urartu]|uniref:Malonyl-coenzyme A:anthocyanin 3-O-glucoside-6''-O-malonyltransferase n=1 Tax=Triticum urartu TaxID=4572 RepID=M7YR45_TRIUA|nr:Malonyl-coenzyme A:anthocyanin 3-O-glucoside-6''-O-malonyltransferase [Triticum urartu]